MERERHGTNNSRCAEWNLEIKMVQNLMVNKLRSGREEKQAKKPFLTLKDAVGR